MAGNEPAGESMGLEINVIAHHEAAHVVISYRMMGHPGGPVSIQRRPEHGTLGYAIDGVSDGTSPSDMEAWILSCYAGGHAQRIIDPSCGDHGCDWDDELAEEQLDAFGWQNREQEFRSRSLDLVRQHWGEIVAVANQLLLHIALDADEVMIIADAAAGDPEADIDQQRRLFDVEEWRRVFLSER